MHICALAGGHLLYPQAAGCCDTLLGMVALSETGYNRQTTGPDLDMCSLKPRPQ